MLRKKKEKNKKKWIEEIRSEEKNRKK